MQLPGRRLGHETDQWAADHLLAAVAYQGRPSITDRLQVPLPIQRVQREWRLPVQHPQARLTPGKVATSWAAASCLAAIHAADSF